MEGVELVGVVELVGEVEMVSCPGLSFVAKEREEGHGISETDHNS